MPLSPEAKDAKEKLGVRERDPWNYFSSVYVYFSGSGSPYMPSPQRSSYISSMKVGSYSSGYAIVWSGMTV